MKVMVTAASRHGATREIAERIAQALSSRGIEVFLRSPETVQTLDGYDAAVVGSAVYMGRWLDQARDLVQNLRAEFAVRPTWLFSSGPVGEPPKPTEEPVDIAEIVAGTHARGHRLFAGCIDRHKLGFGERAVVMSLRAPVGDFRDWQAIDAWAAEIADALSTTAMLTST
ncbi:MAG TPA: flavodoxin domain-containing protein [Micromonosporaceae bacterium]